MTFLILQAALASPVVLSTQTHEAKATVTALTAETCAPVLEGYFSSLRTLTPAQVDLEDARTHGQAIIDDLWATRLALQGRLTAFHAEGTLSEACVTGARRADLASRYLADQVHQLVPAIPDWRTTEGFRSIDDLRSGDILVTRGSALSSAGIAHMGRIDSQFSHNAMVHVDDQGQKWTVEAYLEKGALVQPLDDFLHHGLARIVVLRHPDAILAARASQLAYKRIAEGAPINYDESFRTDDDGEELFCSEIGPWAFTLAGGPKDLPLHPTAFPRTETPQLFDAMGITTDIIAAPVDLLYDPRFELMAEWRDVPNLETLRRQDAVVESLFHWMERDAYAIDPSWANKATVDVGLAVRRTPVLGGALDSMVHPEADRQFLIAGLALQQAGEAVFAELDKRVGAEQPTWDELKGELEEIRADDQAKWLKKPRRSSFHRVFHPPATVAGAER